MELRAPVIAQRSDTKNGGDQVNVQAQRASRHPCGPPAYSPPKPHLLWGGHLPGLWLCSPRSSANTCFLKVADMIKDDQTSLVMITLCPRLACPQSQLPHSGSINYYSNCFPQPTDSKLTACSSVLLHGGQREREGD